MATPYFQLRFDTVPSTQDVVRDELAQLPLLVIARSQTNGRGRSGAEWVSADRALAVSLGFRHGVNDHRPLSLLAGLAAVSVTKGTTLKWPNDVMSGQGKVGGILVERGGDHTIVGLGLNLWWPDAPTGIAALQEHDPGPAMYAEIGSVWGAEMMHLVETPGWPIERYREICDTIGKKIYWEPGGTGRAIDVDETGGLVVETPEGTKIVYSGEVRHVRG